MILEDFIKNQPLVTDIVQTMPQELYQKCRIKEFAPKTLIYEKDEEIQYVYIICSGSVRIMNHFDTGEIYDFAYIESVDILGILEVLAEQPGLATAVQTITKCIMIEIKKEDFLHWMEIDHRFAILVAKALARKVYPTIYKNGAAFIYPAKYTVTDLILQSVKEQLYKQDYGIVQKTRQQIAEELSMNIRTVYRVLKFLKEEGYITIQKAKIHITKKQYNELLYVLESFKDA